MSQLRVRGKVTNALRVGEGIERASQALDSLMDQAIHDLGDRAVTILRDVAPKGRSKQLERGIKARRRGARGIDITIHAIAPETGFDYAAVTRFGHQVEEIVPTEGRKALKVRFQKGDTAYFDRVRGFQPVGDWVDRGLPTIEVESDVVMKQLSAELTVRLFS